MRSSDRPNGHCDGHAGKLVPVVDHDRCGSKEDCMAVCPYNVFEMDTITKEEKADLSLKGRVKAYFLPDKAYVVRPEACHACGLCVPACPERAITLRRLPVGPL
ncbi:MAG: 4Fe-4S dicluster domain-containing protein [Flavobacteriales bacterium]|nr:4Fe-4S dicluster domain-containing protein [Flavobacteriales bacterium]